MGQTLPTPQGIYTQEGNYLMDSRQVGIFNSCVYIPCYSRFTPRNKIAIVKSKMFFFFILTLSKWQNILSKNKPKVYKVRYNINCLFNSQKTYPFSHFNAVQGQNSTKWTYRKFVEIHLHIFKALKFCIYGKKLFSRF